ncbi:MAG: type IX secretion system membrane protein PorP/SprF [Candidatus Pedobacter colombiensis]|uniref:Type IX secretion system membrane protein PorP/SprF n=1 Tax=Candidatus Pedobacter colombiensis TaxID=3121371 RepID=A0AAJ6B8G3_9SPHI|nr:type IX secretion system membrane protein PorP/SprF [Pedobacter sp.]WEK19113.1 MAG: type IX secretion system membrane protein PorP/SprF [Pedobacter sp.]
MKKIFGIILLISTGISIQAQIVPQKSQYYNNPYLVNPAMAGNGHKTSIYLNYSSQWNKIDGGPSLMSISAATPISDKAGIGANLITDKAGLLSRTQAMSSFSYRLPLSENDNLRFGVSLTWSQERLDQAGATSSGIRDPALMSYNDRRDSYFDGNFGVAYQANNLEAQFSYLNLNQKRSHQISTVDYTTFYSSVSYRLSFDKQLSVKPMIVYRGLKGFSNQLDLAAEWSVNANLDFYTMYHSNNSFTGGLGFRSHKFRISTLYNSEPTAVRGLSGGIFDVVLGVEF